MSEERDARAAAGVNNGGVSRRKFLAAGGAAAAADALLLRAPVVRAAEARAARPAASKGYLVYDSKKCAGCTTCMLACSLAHHGVQSLSLARIQVLQDSFGKFPNDIQVAPCRQCVAPVCVQSCPTGAAYVDAENGNVRRIDPAKCIGCRTCIRMCPQQPHRTVWNRLEKKSQKCDLCLDTPYWGGKGGPGGKQACVESCPMMALRMVATVPDQQETDGYDVNLRNDNWLNLGLVADSTVVPPIMAAQAAEAPRGAGGAKPGIKASPRRKE